MLNSQAEPLCVTIRVELDPGGARRANRWDRLEAVADGAEHGVKVESRCRFRAVSGVVTIGDEFGGSAMQVCRGHPNCVWKIIGGIWYVRERGDGFLVVVGEA